MSGFEQGTQVARPRSALGGVGYLIEVIECVQIGEAQLVIALRMIERLSGIAEYAAAVDARHCGMTPRHLGRQRYRLLKFDNRLRCVLSGRRAAMQIEEARVAGMVMKQLRVLGGQRSRPGPFGNGIQPLSEAEEFGFPLAREGLAWQYSFQFAGW
jgi:hypothetical protein